MHVKSHAQELTHVPTKAKSNRRQHVHGKHECTLGRSTFQQDPYIDPEIIESVSRGPHKKVPRILGNPQVKDGENLGTGHCPPRRAWTNRILGYGVGLGFRD